MRNVLRYKMEVMSTENSWKISKGSKHQILTGVYHVEFYLSSYVLIMWTNVNRKIK